MAQMNFEQAWNFLGEKGLTISERMNVRKAFFDAAKQISNIVKNGEYFENKEIKGYMFSSEEEAEFAKHLFNYLSKYERIKQVEILKIINSLCNIESEWKY